MNLSELIEKGWAQHENQTEDTSKQLEAGIDLVEADDPDGASALMHLINHTIGDHAADPARALTACEAVFSRLSTHGNKSPWLHLAVARHLGGDEKGAHKAEGELGQAGESQVRGRMLVAQAKCHAADWEAAANLYNDCLQVAEALKPGHGAERAIAIVSNNIASALVDLEGRSEEQSKLMERAALASRLYWLRVGDWTNDERADYLLALVYNSLGQGGEARDFARRGLKTIATNGEQRVDQAFLEVALARAYKLLEDTEAQQDAILRAQALSDEFGDEKLFEWFETVLVQAK